MGCRNNEMSEQCYVGVMGCRNNGKSHYFDTQICRNSGRIAISTLFVGVYHCMIRTKLYVRTKIISGEKFSQNFAFGRNRFSRILTLQLSDLTKLSDLKLYNVTYFYKLHSWESTSVICVFVYLQF